MIGTQGNIWNTGQGMANQAGQINANTNLGYDTLGAGNQNQFNDASLQQQNITGNQALTQQGQQIGGATDLANAAGGLAQTAQQGDQNQMQNQVQVGQLAMQALQGGAQGQQAQNQLFTQILQGDQAAYQAAMQNGLGRQLQEYMDAKSRDKGSTFDQVLGQTNIGIGG